VKHVRRIARAAVLAALVALSASQSSPGRAEPQEVPVARPPAAVDTPFIYTPLPSGVSYGSFRVAIDSVEAILRRTLGTFADSARWRRDTVETALLDSVAFFHDGSSPPHWTVVEGRPRRLPAFHMLLTTAVDLPDGLDLGGALYIAGWRYDQNAFEEGTDNGNASALVSREAYCSMTTGWEMRSIDDTTRVRAPGVTIEIGCVPRWPAPRDPRIRKR